MSGADAIHYDISSQSGLATAADGAVSVGGGNAVQPGGDTVVPGAMQFVALNDPGMQFLVAGDSAGGAAQSTPPTTGGGLNVDFVELNTASPGMHAVGGASGADTFLFDIWPQGGSAGGGDSVLGATGGAPMQAALEQASAGMLTDFNAGSRAVGGGAMYPDGQAPAGSGGHASTPLQPVVIPFVSGH